MKVLVFKDGSTREITGEAGKYWLCGEERFRRLSDSVAEVREIEEPKKKAAKKKKKTEDADDGEHGK